MLALEILLTSRNQYWKDVTITNVKFVVSTLTLYSSCWTYWKRGCWNPVPHISFFLFENSFGLLQFEAPGCWWVTKSSVTSSTMSFSTNNLIRFGSGTSNLLRILGNNQIGAGNGVTSRSIQLSSGDQSSLGISFYTSLIKLRWLFIF